MIGPSVRQNYIAFCALDTNGFVFYIIAKEITTIKIEQFEFNQAPKSRKKNDDKLNQR